MADKAQVGVRYCGGCNPRYDRVALVRRIGDFFPEAEFVTAQPGVKYPAVLVVCGCLARCADVSDLAVPAGRQICLSGWEDLLPAKEKLTEALKGQEVRRLSHEEVLGILPHRPPMLFIDEVSRLVPGEDVTATFLAHPELPCFAGHFPEQPVLPGISTIEAGFRQKILPGDTLEVHASLLEEKAERGIAVCRGQVLVNGVLAADLELRLAFR